MSFCYLHTCNCCRHAIIFTSRKTKLGIHNQPAISTSTIPLIVIKKALMAKDVFNRKVHAIGTPAATFVL